MKNFPVIVDGKEQWISPSVAAVGIVYKFNEDGKLCFVANKRGEGCPDYNGYWNIPCGYFDFEDESILDGASREIFEETGLNIPAEKWNLWFVNSKPTDGKHVLSIRFIAKFDESFGTFTSENSEEKEVDDIKWISVDEVDNYEWAFNQREVIQDWIKAMERDMIDWKIENKLSIKTYIV